MRDGEILVYRYQYWDEQTDQPVVSSGYATIMAIRSGLGIPIISSGKWVPIAELKGGIHHPPLRELKPERERS